MSIGAETIGLFRGCPACGGARYTLDANGLKLQCGACRGRGVVPVSVPPDALRATLRSALVEHEEVLLPGAQLKDALDDLAAAVWALFVTEPER